MKTEMGNIEHPMSALSQGAATSEGQGGEGELANPATGRLSVQTVERLHRLISGDARVETMALQFIAHQYGARNLLFVPADKAREILRRPADFLRAVKQHCEPELRF
jgi:hypothetical protein